MVKVLVLAGGADESRPTQKEVALMMKRLMLVLAVGILLVAMIMATAIPAFAKGNPNDKVNPDAEFTLNPDGSIDRIEVQVQCAPGVGGCHPPGEDQNPFDQVREP